MPTRVRLWGARKLQSPPAADPPPGQCFRMLKPRQVPSGLAAASLRQIAVPVWTDEAIEDDGPSLRRAVSARKSPRPAASTGDTVTPSRPRRIRRIWCTFRTADVALSEPACASLAFARRGTAARLVPQVRPLSVGDLGELMVVDAQNILGLPGCGNPERGRQFSHIDHSSGGVQANSGCPARVPRCASTPAPVPVRDVRRCEERCRRRSVHRRRVSGR